MIEKIVQKGFLISPKVKEEINELGEDFLNFLEKLEPKPLIIDENIIKKYKENKENIVLGDLKKYKENIKEDNLKVKVKKEYDKLNIGSDVSDWLNYFVSRYNKIRDLILRRENGFQSIAQVRKNKRQGGFIGIVADIRETKKGNLYVTFEDPTGRINCVIKKDLEGANELVLDDVVGIKGDFFNNLFIVSEIIYPDIPEKQIKKYDEDIYIAFTGDVHIGSKMFLDKAFDKFIRWLNLEVGNEKQKELASKIKYLVFIGDLVDGVGIYPNQEKELNINDIYKQYDLFGKYLENLKRDDLKVILIPGNHDAVRLHEPQPKLPKDIAAPIYDLDLISTTNPALVNIHNVNGFPGLDILVYHGYSYDYYIDQVEILKESGYERVDKVMKFLLKKRHLAPTYGSSPVVPVDNDPLVIDYIPDIFVSGHVHSTAYSKYKNVTLLVSSCWQSKTTFQEMLGHKPDPGKVPLYNMRTAEVYITNFL